MKSTMHVWPQAIQTTADHLILSARIELGTQAPQTLWYRLPRTYESALSSNHDPFAVAVLLAAMAKANRLVIHGEVSPSLLQNLEEFQAAWACWLPAELSEIPIVVDQEREPQLQRAAPAAISTFSGGVDSSYTVFSHTRGHNGRRTHPLKAGLFIHGLDIPLDQTHAFQQATQRAAQTLNSVGVVLIPMATNFRAVIDPYIHWENSFGSALASCLLMLQGRFNIGLIPSSYYYQTLSFPYGSNVITDPLLGNQNFSIVHDGSRYRRFGKVKHLATWPEALETLRVCWQGAQKDRNCCRCEKCIRTILTFRLVQPERPPCFIADVTDDQIRQLRLRGGALDAFESLSYAAQKQGINQPWVTAVAHAVRRSRRQNFFKQTFKDPLKQRLKFLKKFYV